MPAQRKRQREHTVPSAPSRAESKPDASRRRVLVLGAGVDMTYGIPVMSTLLRELASFAETDGRPIHAALRKRLPNLRFNFEKYAGDQSNEMLRQLFSSDNHDLVGILRITAGRLRGDSALSAVGDLIEQLCRLAENNQLNPKAATGVAQFAGSNADMSGGEAILDPDHIVLTSPVAQGLRQAFVTALEDDDPFDEEQRKRIEYFIEATSNVEQLMSLYFTKYTLGRPADQKAYLYIVWMLWSFLRVRSHNPPVRRSLYDALPTLPGDVITFNYTDFFDTNTGKRALFFHGRLSEYLQLDNREVVKRGPELEAATNVEGIVRLIESIRLDLTTGAVDAPAIVPPTKFKPVMARRQLRTWAAADDVITHASSIVVIGYSFALADEHFNDLLRHASPQTRIIVVNPDIATASREACRVLGLDSSALVAGEHSGIELRRLGRLVCIRAKAEDVTLELLTSLE